jgi:hypothetical protein
MRRKTGRIYREERSKGIITGFRAVRRNHLNKVLTFYVYKQKLGVTKCIDFDCLKTYFIYQKEPAHEKVFCYLPQAYDR